MSFNHNFIKACKRETVDHVPVWYMRQAGRYQEAYRAIRKKYSLMEIVKRPDVCSEVTLLPIHQLGVDAAILFSDIMTPIEAIGVPNEIKPNYGPFIPNPIRTREAIDQIHLPSFAEEIPYVGKTIQLLKQELKVPLIGFSGAPFTLASYIVEGGPSKNYTHSKTMLFDKPNDWKLLMEKLQQSMAAYVNYQIESGVDAIQFFDSWVGALAAREYEHFVLPYLVEMIQEVKTKYPNTPIIYFGVNTGHLMEQIMRLPVDVIGIDWRMDLNQALEIMDRGFAIQGNLDPAILFSSWEVIKQQVDTILNTFANEKGFIFNLGHGVTPQVNPDVLIQITNYIHGK